MDFIPYAKQAISQEDIQAVSEALASPFLTRGPKVIQFEEDIARYCDAEYAVAFPNGTEALAAATFAAKITPFDRLITSPNTFIASATSAWRFGAQVLLADIVYETGNVNLDLMLEHSENPLSRGRYFLMPVHYGGIACDMKSLSIKVKDPNIVIIEDGCAALGADYPSGEKVGSCAYSDMTTFSFHPAKSIATGEGGMVTTNSHELAERLRLYRNNGIVRDPKSYKNPDLGPWYYEVQEVTVNNNVTDFQAALGSSQLKRLPEMLERRKMLVKHYYKLFSDFEQVILMPEETNMRSAHNLFCIKIDFSKASITKRAFMERLKERGIGTQVHYLPVHHHPVYKDRYPSNTEDLSVSDRFYSEVMTLPLYYDLKESEVEYVVAELKSILHGKS